MIFMELIAKLPEKSGTIGANEIVKSIKSGKMKKVVIASNCPDFLIDKLKQSGNVSIEKFTGDESQLGTKLGKPFPVAMVGYE